MTGLLIGVVCGAGELFLLTHFTRLVLSGSSFKAVGVLFAKLLLLAAALVPVLLFFKQDLIWCGVGVSSVLIIGAFILNVRMRKNGKGDR